MKRIEKVECNECENKRCFIKLCNPKYIAILSEKKNQRIVQKSQYIFHEGNPIFGIHFIQHGNVKVISSNINGKQQIVRLAGDGHILGHRGYGGETYPIGAIALNQSRICFIDNNTLLEAFKANFNFLYEIMLFYSKELRKSEQRTKYFAQMTVEEKITFALLYIIETVDSDVEGHLLNPSITRQDIAEIAGTNSDQVSRTITSLRNHNLIKLDGKKIFIESLDGIKEIVQQYKYDFF